MSDAGYFVVERGKKVFKDDSLSVGRVKTKRLKVSSRADMSVVIPVFERPEVIACLNYLLCSLEDAGKSAHIVVVDQSLHKETRDVIYQGLQDIRARAGVASIVYHFDATLTISTAKNKGTQLLQESSQITSIGNFLLFIDSDVYLPRKTIQLLWERADEHPEMSAFGFPSMWLRDSTDLAYLDHPPAFDRLPRELINKPEGSLLRQGMLLRTKGVVQVPAIHGCFFAVRTPVFLEVGGFHPFFGMHGEHVELCARLTDLGYHMAYIMSSVIFHDDRTTLQYSIMRNLPGRERFLLATLVAMAARNEMRTNHEAEEVFLNLMRRKWLKNIGVKDQHIELTVALILELAELLRHFYHKGREFVDRALQLIDRNRIHLTIDRYLAETIEYISQNGETLASIFVSAPRHKELYKLHLQ
ncbi:MAG TPA: glycosyltransferase [Verrucomicrobiae bacterium]|nr:glycosyltransferase [Verrucomicrobiae bacterium]